MICADAEATCSEIGRSHVPHQQFCMLSTSSQWVREFTVLQQAWRSEPTIWHVYEHEASVEGEAALWEKKNGKKERPRFAHSSSSINWDQNKPGALRRGDTLAPLGSSSLALLELLNLGPWAIKL